MGVCLPSSKLLGSPLYRPLSHKALQENNIYSMLLKFQVEFFSKRFEIINGWQYQNKNIQKSLFNNFEFES